MMHELGGPSPRESIPDKVRRDAAATRDDESWSAIIVSDADEAMGNVCIWTHETESASFSEIGWMVLPAFQGRGIGRAAATAILERARVDGRWGVIHAFPGVTNAPSNGICRSLGFTMIQTVDFDYAGATLRCNHWQIDADSFDPQPSSGVRGEVVN
jgi:RimJ/RimL family protein N-acetyltransferase